MKTKKTLALILLTLCVAALVALSGCRPRQRVRSATEKDYELKGKVVAVEKDKHLVTVAHEDIKDYMPGMTMPFTVADDSAWVFEVPLTPGDQITATLVVDGARSWLENLVIVKESTDTTSPSSVETLGAKPGDEMPNYRLVNQDAKTIRMQDYRGKALLLTFIYTRCPQPDQCTLMSSNFAAIDQDLQKQPDLYGKTHLLSISFDPEYDTPKVLRSYGAAFTGKYSDETFSHWEFASGTADEVKGIAQFFGLRYYQNGPSGEEQVIHSLRTAIIGPDGKVFKVYRGNDWKPDELLTELKTAVGNTSSAPTKSK
ncbi:MAG TPA: redoxin [Blastocatellia bacterium]|nr:redoxin [Blastocatellia bacterium]HCX28736.1 redoxin [Blastocatellia bacterium]